jgi:hypothetical protein
MAINTYADKSGLSEVQFLSDPCPVCGLVHYLYNKVAANHGFICVAAGNPGTWVDTVYAGFGTPAPAPVLAALASGQWTQVTGAN